MGRTILKALGLGVGLAAGLMAYVEFWKDHDGLPLSVRINIVNARKAIADSRFSDAITEYEKVSCSFTLALTEHFSSPLPVPKFLSNPHVGF